MAGVSVSNLIIFIAAVSVAAAVSGTLVSTVTDISDSIDERGLHASERIQTEVEVISDPGSDAVYDGAGPSVTLLVKNTGTRALGASTDGIDVVLDGRYRTDLTLAVVGGGAWEQGDVVELTVGLDASLDGGTHRVLVVVGGDREVFRFRV